MADYTKEQLMTALRAADSAGDTDGAKRIAVMINAINTAPTPVEDKNMLENTFDSVFGAVKQMPKSALGLVEGALSVGTGMVAEPVSGLLGLAALPFGGEASAKVVKGVQEGMTYVPRTKEGRQVLEGVGKVLTPVAKAQEAVETGLSDVAGTAAEKLGASDEGISTASTIAHTLPTAIMEIAGLGIGRRAKKAAIAAEIKALNEGTDGKPKIITIDPETEELLKRQGFTDEELSTMVELDQDQLARLKRFDELGIQPTRGDVTMSTAERKAEQQLLETAEGTASNEMRALRAGQSQDVRSALEKTVSKISLDNEVVGAHIKDALASRKKIVKADAKAAYDALAKTQESLDGIPLIVSDDFRSIPNVPEGGDLRTIKAVNKGNFTALEDLMTEFGLNANEKVLARLAEEGVHPEKVNITNFERLRQRLGIIENSDETGQISRVIGPIRNELDRQVDLATATLIKNDNPNIAFLAKEARRNWTAYKTEFDPKGLAEMLTKNKPKSTIPAIEASRAYKEIAANKTPIEQVDRLMVTLKESGPKGKRAIADIQSNMGTDLLDSMFTGASNKIDGTPVFSGAAFTKKFNDPEFSKKMKLVFENNPRAYKQLVKISKSIEDLTPGKLEIVKGSGSTILDIANTVGIAKVMTAIPFGSSLMQGLGELGARSKNKKAMTRALEARPDFKRSANIIASDYPMLAAVLGIGYLSGQEEE